MCKLGAGRGLKGQNSPIRTRSYEAVCLLDESDDLLNNAVHFPATKYECPPEPPRVDKIHPEETSLVCKTPTMSSIGLPSSFSSVAQTAALPRSLHYWLQQ